MNQTMISIAKSFTDTPAGRMKTDGPFSGERFREEILVPALTAPGKVIVDLNGVLGFGSSFLEEAFGGLVRSRSFTVKDLQDRLQIVSDLAVYQRRIWKYITDARS